MVIGVATLVVAGVTAGVQAYEAKKAGKKAKHLADEQSAHLLEQATSQASGLQQAGERLVSSQQAAYGAAGVQQTGSARHVIDESVRINLQDQSRILHGAARNSEIIQSNARRQAKAGERAATIKLAGVALSYGAQELGAYLDGAFDDPNTGDSA